ncbi:MAG: hypothetical protein AB7O97_02270 [Planctomycetota bacterium]
MKWLPWICALCLVLLAGTVWSLLNRGTDIAVPVHATQTGAAPAGDGDRAALLAAARRRCDPAALDAFVAEQEALLARGDAAPAALRLCAEARIERVLLQNQLRGMSIGEPLYAELPAAVAADLDRALELLQRARGSGDDSAANHRLEAVALGQRITGLGTALQWNGRIEAALARAAERDERDPALHVTLGLRKLLAPRFLGHDADGALEHLRYAAEALAGDERPRVFAAMAAYLCKKRVQAIEWLERAVSENPNNVFARVVLRRLRRGEEAPFARDVTPEEAAAK